jgi:hypothetical protein
MITLDRDCIADIQPHTTQAAPECAQDFARLPEILPTALDCITDANMLDTCRYSYSRYAGVAFVYHALLGVSAAGRAKTYIWTVVAASELWRHLKQPLDGHPTYSNTYDR